MGSETPKCDAAEFDWTATCRGEAPDKPANVVDASFARTLESEAARLRHDIERHVAALAAEVKEREEFERDARRYRFLRDRAFAYPRDREGVMLYGRALDESLDAALSGETR